ncbi:[protein-PII] uridylyltransferase [Hyphobacterium sp. HN65]|uniref:Bifunctional uridylyltransferase/uridylyl-removing enzyme n=1 Tax=Hyphobacterium lacteum TaxID=3116575 RepID=A0ABU7LRZ5_9PROT|nr:[protein-PII] uridylyltransferase [Hyphobacterium sp. HN65]MEE2526678.1 [protein-PII] uridylyltransferase [Hyphobacterium sp. HN65]
MLVSALPASLDGLKLRAELAAALGDKSWQDMPARNAAIARIRSAIEAGRAAAKDKLKGSTGGLESARFLSGVMNAVLAAVYDSIAMEAGDAAQGISMTAIGGYGAGELAPRSDIDLLFLKPKRAGKAHEAFLEQLIYVLWDCGLDVGGGAVRTVDETLDVARDNIGERTSLLSLRHLAGNPGLSEMLRRKLREEALSKGAAFVEAKLEERDARISKAGASRYTVEPNVKESKGGLRDLQLLRWLAQFLYGADAFERWVSSGLMTVTDVEKYLRASDFFWTVRFHIHDIIDGKDDRLTFDIQPEIAARMGFDDAEAESAVERFMRRYFLTAMDVGSLTRLVCAKLESDHRKSRPRGLARFLPESDALGDPVDEAFKLVDGRIDFADPSEIENDPVLLMRLFWAASAMGADLHPDAFAVVGQNIRRVDDEFRSDPRAVRVFFSILLDSGAPQLVLRLMTEAGLLGKFLPEFGEIVARTQFNMYHRYTVDEHTLHLVGLLRDIENGDLQGDHPVASRIVHEIKNRRALHLAALLHDTGKGRGDQCVEGAEQARTACTRLGLPSAEVELVAWLVRTHLLMSDTAQRRDIGDPKTVIEFAREVGTLERLNLLTILTVIDIRAVGPGIWNGWKGQLLRDLYSATRSVLESDASSDAEAEVRTILKAQADESRAAFREKIGRVDEGFAERWTTDLDDAYWLSFSEADRLRHAAFVRAAKDRGDVVAATARIDKRRAATEVMVIAPDRERLFADIVGVLAELGANVVGAQVSTTASGDAFDVFYVQDSSGNPYGIERGRARDALAERVRRAASGSKTRAAKPAVARLTRRAAAFTVTPSVSVDSSAAETATLIEASGRDRPGLLADLSEAIADAGLALQSARIDGYGERATDVFYVLRDGKKLEDSADREAVRESLLDVLAQEEERVAKRARTRGLARARASAGR